MSPYRARFHMPRAPRPWVRGECNNPLPPLNAGYPCDECGHELGIHDLDGPCMERVNGQRCTCPSWRGKYEQPSGKGAA